MSHRGDGCTVCAATGGEGILFCLLTPGTLFPTGGAHPALCLRCAKSQLFSTNTGSHRSQGPKFCTLPPLLIHQGFFCFLV